jgi:hypothetical protein
MRLALEAEGDLVGGDGALAEDGPGGAGEVDDGGGDGAGGGPAVDDEGDFVAELLSDATGVGALGAAVEVGGGGGDGEAELGDDGAGDGRLRDAEGDVAGVGGDAQGEAGAGFDNDGEGAGPEALGEEVEGVVALAGETVGLGDVGDEEREGLVAGAIFELVDAVDGVEVDGVDGEAVEGVGRATSWPLASVEATKSIRAGSGSSGWMRRISAVKMGAPWIRKPGSGKRGKGLKTTLVPNPQPSIMGSGRGGIGRTGEA